MTKKIIKYIVFVALMTCIGFWLNPSMRIRTEGDIRLSLIKKMPLGSQASQVVNDIQQKWKKESIKLNQHPLNVRGPNGYFVPVGAKSVGPVEIGWYWTTIPGLPMVTNVFATWVFDKNDQLIDVLVHKEIDAP